MDISLLSYYYGAIQTSLYRRWFGGKTSCMVGGIAFKVRGERATRNWISVLAMFA
jgi:hypothetical protein